jgi:aspartyl-tRNA(Asn)/glutamyl-tRNA(Gln) amidotransferase subunit A
MTFTALSATELAHLVRGGEASAAEILDAHIARIEAFDQRLNCFTDRTFSRARAEAAAVDAKRAAGAALGPLAGVPIAVKNLYDVRGLTTRAGSKILRDNPPAAADAPVLGKLAGAGAVLLGALNMDEFAFGFMTENAHDGATHNPHDESRVAGGSSGGSAAAIAAGFAALTLGSDTNGSVRVPAAFCGIFGLKPTYGRLDRTGLYPFVDSFDHAGLFARSTGDLVAAYDVMQDADSPAQSAMPARIATLGGWFTRGAAPEILAALTAAARGLGATATVELPGAEAARAAAFCISAFEGGQLHKKSLQTRSQDFDPATLPRLQAGALLPAEWVYQAQRLRTAFRAEAAALFRDYDLLIAPTAPCVAPLIGQKTMVMDGVEIPVRPFLGVYTQPLSFIGLPVAAVPIAGPGLPCGVQLIAAPGRERTALAAAAALEAAGIAAAPLAALS